MVPEIVVVVAVGEGAATRDLMRTRPAGAWRGVEATAETEVGGGG